MQAPLEERWHTWHPGLGILPPLAVTQPLRTASMAFSSSL